MKILRSRSTPSVSLLSALLILANACASSSGDGDGKEWDNDVTTGGASVDDGVGGGSAQTGGTSPSGGADSAGGSGASGGANSSGGSEATGGADSAGGAESPASGGGLATGGVASTGGGDSTGGLGSTGGAESSGGGESTGGSTGGGDDSCPAEVEGFGENVTGGDGGNVVTASTGTEIHKAICDRAADDTPLVIMVDGTITPGNTSKQSGSCNTADGVIELKEISNISLIGVGESGVLDQVGVHIRSSSNIIIQNLTIKNVRKSNTDTPSNGGDAIGMESDVSHIWIDRNLIFGSTTEGEEHDGLVDMKTNTTDVTISCNHLHTSGRGGLVVSNDSGTDGSTRITWHHNWYQNLSSRTHLVREAHGHFYNNYYSGILSTGINSRNGASLLIEGNYFTDSRNPLGTFFYTENPGVFEVHDNFFDASVVWESTSDEIPAGPNVQSTGSVSVPYQYSLDSVQDVPGIVMSNAGVGKLP
jgi:pectate lyase